MLRGGRVITQHRYEEEDEDEDDNETHYGKDFMNYFTNSENKKIQQNQKEQMNIAVKQVENKCCKFITTAYYENYKKLIKVLVEETNKQFANQSVQKSVQGTLIRIVADVLNDEDTRETILKHLRGGCKVSLDIEERIKEKQRIITEAREQDFIQNLNRVSEKRMSGGDGDENPFKINVDTPEMIESELFDGKFIQIFKSYLFTEVKIKNIAKDMIQSTIRTNPDIKNKLFHVIDVVLKETFDAKKMKSIFVEKLSGQCYQSIVSKTEETKKEQKKQPHLEDVILKIFQNQEKNKNKNEEKKEEKKEENINEIKTVGGGITKKIHTKHVKNHTKKIYSGGGVKYTPIQQLSFKDLITRATPIIKSCLCDCVKHMYKISTVEIFQNYYEFCKMQVDSDVSDVIDAAKVNYGKILDGYLNSPEKQIKFDIRDNVTGKCPPLQDTEIKFTGTNFIKKGGIGKQTKRKYPKRFTPLMYINS